MREPVLVLIGFEAGRWTATPARHILFISMDDEQVRVYLNAESDAEMKWVQGPRGENDEIVREFLRAWGDPLIRLPEVPA